MRPILHHLAKTRRKPNIIPMSDTSSAPGLRIQLSEARTDTKFAEMLGEMRTGFAGINGRLDHLEKTGVDVKATVSNVKTTVIGTGIGVLALTLAALSYGQAWFGIGVSTRDVVKSAVTEYVQQHPNPLPAPPVK